MNLYTRWQRTLWPDKSVEKISQAAMKQRHEGQSPENKELCPKNPSPYPRQDVLSTFFFSRSVIRSHARSMSAILATLTPGLCVLPTRWCSVAPECRRVPAPIRSGRCFRQAARQRTAGQP